MINNDPVPVLPCSSVAEHVTLVLPSGNTVSGAGLHDTVTEPSIISVEVTVKVTILPDGPVASTVIGRGRKRLGAVVSSTVIVKLSGALLPVSSVTVQLTVVVPTGYIEPD